MDKGLAFNTSKILRKPDLALKLQEDGYVTFPFMRAEGIEKLKEYYFNFQKETPGHFYSSTHSKDYSFRKKTSNFIHEVVAPLLNSEFENYKLLGGAFVVKPPNGKGLLPPHQDWNIADETKTRSFNLWIPLTDVNIANGAVFVLKGSHAKIPTYRGPGIPSLFKNIEKEVWENLEPLPMSAGEALLYDHALLHASPANSTEQIRLGIVCGIIAKGQEMQLCFNKEGEVEIYNADESFFMEKDPEKGPGDLSFIKSLKPEYSELNAEQFNAIFLKNVQQKNTSWLKKIFGGS